MSKLVSIGKILNFHGIKGEVRLGFSAGKESLIKNLKQVFVFVDDSKMSLDVESVRFHKNFAIVKFKQINTIDEVTKVKGLLVHTTEDVLKSKLDEDEFLVNDLIGLTAFDTQDNEIGHVFNVGENGASYLIEIKKPNGLSFMVPFVKELVPVVDIQAKKVVINLIEGMDSTVNSDED